ncbi:MAG: histidine kinase, partial [Spirosoma sp.]|nr:histidine kinase [Spirosoma sp.]
MFIFDQLRARNTNQRIALGFMVALVLIVSGFALSFYSYYQYGKDTGRVRHTYQVISALESTLSLVKDVETGMRGFVITNDSTFLEPYKKAMQLLPVQLETVRKLIADNSSQVRHEVKLEQLIGEKVAVTKLRGHTKMADLRRGLTYSSEGQQIMNQLRGHVAMMVDTEKYLMAARNRQADRSFRNTLIIISALSLLTLLVLVISYRQLE